MLKLHRVLFVCLISVSVAATPLYGQDWKAGHARVKITPQQPMWMSGYGSRNRAADGKLTDLWAKALVLQDGSGNRAVLVTMDLIGIDRELSSSVCDALLKKHQLPRHAIALSTTHTHTGPVVGRNLTAMYFLDQQQKALVAKYTTKLQQQLIDLVGRAMQDVEPVTIRWGGGTASFAVNRRNNPEAKVPELRKQGKLKGPVDHGVGVLGVWKEDGSLKTLVAGYACHATVLSFYKWSGDWPGFAQIELEKQHPGAMAMIWAGCGADQNPLPRRTAELAEGYGQQLAKAVDDVLKSKDKLKTIDGHLATAYHETELPFAHIPTREELETNAKSANRFEASRAKHLLEGLDRDGKIRNSYPYPVQVWQLGKGPAWVFLGGEVVVDFSLRLKAELGWKSTWVAAYTNDVMAYIPSRRVLGEGGYEGAGAMVYYGLPSPWKVGVEKLVVDEVRSLAAKAKKEADKKTADVYHYDHRRLRFYIDAKGLPQKIRTPEDWQRRRRHILDGMQRAMGKLPDRTKLEPLDIRVTKKIEGDGFTRETISFVAERGDRIPAHLYLPTGKAAQPRRPAMLALHPTSSLGKRIVAGEGPLANRQYAVELAQRGYIVLAPDYPSFGDYSGYDFTSDRYVSGTMKGIFNHMRCVDLLSERTDVDPERIGVIGHSLGGHNAMFVGVFDRRLKVIVSSCGWTPFHDYYEGRIKAWSDPRYMPWLDEKYGLDPDRVPFDFYEVAAALAPRGFYSSSPTRDANFDVRGVKKAKPRIRRIYRLLGNKEALKIEHPDCEHDFPPATRRSAYRFIDTMLKHKPVRKVPVK